MPSLLGVRDGIQKVSMLGQSTTEAEGNIEIPNDIRTTLLYATEVFIEPFKARKYTSVEENYFNFEYITNKLHSLLELNSSNEDLYTLIDTNINTICSIQRAMDIRLSLTNCFTDAFSDKQSNSVILETSRLTVSNIYFIYNFLIGVPVHSTEYDKGKLDIIKVVLESNAGITMDQLRENTDIINIIPEI